MSSLLRSTRLLVNYALRRNITPVYNRWMGRNSRINGSHAASTLSRHFSTEEANINQENSAVRNLSSLEKQLEIMDSNVRWRGRIDREDMERAMTHLKTHDTVAEQSGLMLLRCCGSLLPKESPEDRMKMFNTLWETLQKKGVEFKTSHYNARLRCQLENRHKFEVADILSEMESSPNTLPNRVTYQLLISRYCEEGDIEGSKKILQHMKNEQIPIGEAVFNSLIRGHLKQGDTAGYEEVMNTMKSHGVYPSSETYKTILRCHAEKGDMDAITKVLQDAEADLFNIMASHVLPAVYDLVENGHEDKLDQLLTHALNPRNHEVLNTVHQMIARGYDKAALSVYNLLKPEESAKESVLAGGRSVLRSMIMHGRTIDQIKSTMEMLTETGRFEDDVGLVGIYALSCGQSALATDAFRAMHGEEMPVRSHYFWPIFKAGTKNKDTEGIYNAVSCMTELASTCPGYLSTLFIHVYKPLLRVESDPTLVVTKFQECGVKSSFINSIQLLQLLRTGQFQEAVTFAESSPFEFDSDLIKNAVYTGLGRNEDWTSLIEFMSLIQSTVKGAKNQNTVENICSILVSRKQYTAEDLSDMVNKWVEKKLTILPRTLENIKKKLEEKGVAASVIEKLDDLKAVPRRREPLSGSEISQMSYEQLEKELAQRLPKDRDVRSMEKALLLRYCTVGEVEKAEPLYDQLKDQGFVFTPDVTRQMGILAARYKKDLEGALKSIEELNTKHPEFHSYDALILRTALLQVTSGKQEDALALLEKHTEMHGEQKSDADFVMQQIIGDLVKASRENSPPDFTEKLVDTLFEGKYIRAGAYNIIQAVVESYLDKEDYDGLVKVLEKYEREYNRVPNYGRVFRALIEKEDAEKLQKVVDLVTTIQDEMAVLQQLALTFVECKKYKQAQKILETPGLRASMPVLSQGLDRFVQNNKEEELKALVNITRELFGCDREEIVFSLIRLYASEEKPDADKCLDVLQMFEEESIKPRPRTLRYLAKVLESVGKPVPFEVPRLAMDGPVPQTPLEEEASKALKSGDMEGLCRTVERCSDTEKISTDFLTETLKVLAKRQPRAPARMFIKSLGDNSCVEALDQIIDSDLQNKNLVTFAKQQRFVAQILSGSAEETLTLMKASPADCSEHLSAAALILIQEKRPELMSQVDEMIEQYLAEDPEKPIAANALFNHYAIRGEREKAEALWRSSESFRLKSRLIKSAEILCQERNEEGLRWLLSLTKEVSAIKSSLIFSQLVSLKNANSDWQGGLEVVQEAKAEGLDYTNLWKPAMKQLERQLINNNQQLPWEEGIFDQNTHYDSRSTELPELGSPQQHKE